jgi:cyclophilin family peptidyl-prolyl cis-trans isomerase/HEAT repeat protein
MRFFILLISIFATNLLAYIEPTPLTAQESSIEQIYRLTDQRNPNSPIFASALKSSDFELQEVALLGLGRIGGQEVIKRLTPFLSNKNEKLRQLAAFSLGLSANKEVTHYLWQQLEIEQSDLVKKEIYLGLGNIGQKNLVKKMMQRLTKEKSRASQSALFQGLGIALTFHRDLKEDYGQLDYPMLLKLFSIGDDKAATVGSFLSRIPKIETFINAGDLLPLTKITMSPQSNGFVARLIGKVTTVQHPANRELLAWALEKSESEILTIQLEAIRALKNFLDKPQALIQLGKLHISPNPIVAQTALKVIADSNLDTPEVIQLLKKQLKSKNPAMIVDAMSGLITRQSKGEMTWVLQFFAHESDYVKIRLMSLLKRKSQQENEDASPADNFDNVIKMFSNSPNKKTSQFAKSLLASSPKNVEAKAKSPSYILAVNAAKKQVKLKTSNGDITIQLYKEAPFTSWHFINNIKSGYFNGSYFNRVIGNFVAQGGDNIGNGEGSSGKTIREEINFHSHELMTVGMATAGKDTGSSQFFINTGRNLHLDRNYTVFGKVIKGQENVLSMTHGAIIFSAEVN